MVYPQMPPLTQDEMESFLKQAPFVRFCSINEDGSVHAVPLFFKYENGQIVMVTHVVCRKVRNIKRNNNVTVLVDTHEPPFKGAMIYGKAKLDYENVFANRVSIFERYMPRDKAEALARGLANLWKPVIIRVKPERIVSYDYAKDPSGLFR